MQEQDRLLRWRSSIGLVKRYSCRGICVLIGLSFAWWEGYWRWPSRAAHISIFAAIVCMFALALAAGRHRQSMSSANWLLRVWTGVRHPSTKSPVEIAGVLIWVVLVLAVAGWDFHSFLLEEHSLPTLSYLIGRISRFTLGRSVLVAIWLALGGLFVLANRVHSGDKNPIVTRSSTDVVEGDQQGDSES